MYFFNPIKAQLIVPCVKRFCCVKNYNGELDLYGLQNA